MLWPGFLNEASLLRGDKKWNGSLQKLRICNMICTVSVAYKQCPDPYVFGPPGSVIIFTDLVPDPFIIKQKIKKNLDFIQFCYFLITFCL